MDLQLTNKTVLVTGANAGIGYAIAKGFAAEGAIVYLNGRDQQKVAGAKSKIEREIAGAKIYGVVADLATAAGAAELVSQLPEIDILINNVGIFKPVGFFDLTDEDWTRMFEVNVMSGVRLSKHYMPKMLEKNWGRIIFISSESALQVPPEMIHYGTTKTAQLAVTNGLAQLTKGTGVTVNAVLPGPTYSEGVQQFVSDLAQQRGISVKEMEHVFFAEARPLSLLQRFITTDEVAATVVFTASPLAAATNGAAVKAEGGITKGLS